MHGSEESSSDDLISDLETKRIIIKTTYSVSRLVTRQGELREFGGSKHVSFAGCIWKPEEFETGIVDVDSEFEASVNTLREHIE